MHDLRAAIGSLALLLVVACAASDEDDGPAADVGATSGAAGSSDDGSVDTTASADDDGPAPGDDGAADTAPPTDDDGGDAPPGDTGDDGGSTGEAPIGLGCEGRSDLLLCDDFEDGAIDEALWSTVFADNGATIEVDGELPFHGDGALHIHLPLADAARGGVRTSAPFPVADNHFFGRAMFHMTPAISQTHSSAMAAHGVLDGTGTNYRLDCNGGEFNSRYTNNVTVEQHGGLRKFGYDAPVGQWLCVEWEYDGSANTMRYWMDGEEIEDMTVTADSEAQPWVAPIFEDFEIGWRTFQAGDEPGGYDVYWDAVALATFRIGCGD